MRQISKGPEPAPLADWKAENHGLVNYSYASLGAVHRQAIRASLVGEQRGLCAYTGRRIEDGSCHIEHLRPQSHCVNGEDLDFGNLVAAVPAPNTPTLPYGAHKKDNWPSLAEEPSFVSPLSEGCEGRFEFDLRGHVASAPGDAAASTTIDRLALDHPQLVELRKAAIDATLVAPRKGPASLDIADAEKRIQSLEMADQGADPLEPFSFVLKQALQRHINRIQKISGEMG